MWLRMPFALKVSGDAFQERLDRVIRLVPGVLGIADDMVPQKTYMIEQS